MCGPSNCVYYIYVVQQKVPNLFGGQLWAVQNSFDGCTNEPSMCRTHGNDCYGACTEPPVCANGYQPIVDWSSCTLKCFAPSCAGSAFLCWSTVGIAFPDQPPELGWHCTSGSDLSDLYSATHHSRVNDFRDSNAATCSRMSRRSEGICVAQFGCQWIASSQQCVRISMRSGIRLQPFSFCNDNASVPSRDTYPRPARCMDQGQDCCACVAYNDGDIGDAYRRCDDPRDFPRCEPGFVPSNYPHTRESCPNYEGIPTNSPGAATSKPINFIVVRHVVWPYYTMLK